MEQRGNWRVRAILIGGVVGALVGVGAASLLVQRAEREGAQPRVSPGEGVRLGLLVLGLLREIGELADRGEG